MSEWLAAEITIGDKCPRKLVVDLCKAIDETECSLEYGGNFFGPKTEQDLLDASNKSKLLRLVSDQAENGEFPAIEEFCIKHRLAFDRHSDGRDEYDAENVRFRSGMVQPYVCYSTQAGHDLVNADDLRLVLKRAKTKENEIHAVLADTINGLEKLLPNVPKLKPFRIVD